MADPTGEADKSALRLDFDRRLLLQFRSSSITSDARLLAYRELDDTLRRTDTGPIRWLMCAPARTVAIGWRAFCANRCSGGGRLRGRERRREAVPRPSDAGRRP